MLEPLGRRLGGDHALLPVTGNDARKDDIDADMVGPRSIAQVSVKPITPYLEAEPPAAFSKGTARQVQRKGLVRLTLLVWSQSASAGSSTVAVKPAMPALLTRTSSAPQRAFSSTNMASTWVSLDTSVTAHRAVLAAMRAGDGAAARTALALDINGAAEFILSESGLKEG